MSKDKIRTSAEQPSGASTEGNFQLDDGVYDPPSSEKRFGYYPGQWPGYPVDAMPPHFPAVPLGLSKTGKSLFFLNSLGQFLEMGMSELKGNGPDFLVAGYPNVLQHCWPRWAKPKDGSNEMKINGTETKHIVGCLLKQAEKNKVLDPIEIVFGRGAWLSEQYGIIWNSGDVVFMLEDGVLRQATSRIISGKVYPRGATLIAPFEHPVEHSNTPATKILEAFKTWHWRRGALDPVLTIGWICSALLAGALKWRPYIYVTGESGSGKSTFYTFLKACLGGICIESEDPSGASIYQDIGFDCLPVAVDEFEPTLGEERIKRILALARIAASGGIVTRGSIDQKTNKYRIISPFMFCSINVPRMEGADQSRCILINFQPRDESVHGNTIPEANPVWASQLLRQVMQSWGGFNALLHRWKASLESGNLDPRHQATYGVLLALAHMVLGDAAMQALGFPVDDAAALGAYVASLTEVERETRTENWADCLNYILDSNLGIWKAGEQNTVSTVLERYRLELKGTFHDPENEGLSLRTVRKMLGTVGIGLVHTGDKNDPLYLAVPTGKDNRKVSELFERKEKWRGGSWVTALRQAPPSILTKDGSVVKIGGTAHRCMLLDMTRFDGRLSDKAAPFSSPLASSTAQEKDIFDDITL